MPCLLRELSDTGLQELGGELTLRPTHRSAPPAVLSTPPMQCRSISAPTAVFRMHWPRCHPTLVAPLTQCRTPSSGSACLPRIPQRGPDTWPCGPQPARHHAYGRELEGFRDRPSPRGFHPDAHTFALTAGRLPRPACTARRSPGWIWRESRPSARSSPRHVTTRTGGSVTATALTPRGMHEAPRCKLSKSTNKIPPSEQPLRLSPPPRGPAARTPALHAGDPGLRSPPPSVLALAPICGMFCVTVSTRSLQLYKRPSLLMCPWPRVLRRRTSARSARSPVAPALSYRSSGRRANGGFPEE